MWGNFGQPPRGQPPAAERRFRTFPLSPVDGGLTPKRTIQAGQKWNLLKAVERPFDWHAEKILAAGLVSSRRNVRMVLNRVHIAKVTLEAVLVANPGCSDRLVHEIDCSNCRGYGIGRASCSFILPGMSIRAPSSALSQTSRSASYK